MTTAAKPIQMTANELHDMFDYRDGELYWKVKPCKHIAIGSRAGGKSPNGYRYVNVNKVKYLEHRIIFKMHTGDEPTHVDHIDQDPLNNKIENLRASDVAQNAWNTKTPVTNQSGVMGVHWDKIRNKWMAYMRHNGKRKHLGYFDKFDDAVEARKKGEILRQVEAGTLTIVDAE